MIYNKLASYYDELVKDDEATKCWVNWIEKECRPCTLLELACGSGEITLALSKDGYAVTALDLSEQMVEKAKAKDVDGKILFYVQDMKDLSNLPTFDAITCLCDSFNYILSKKEVIHFFQEVHNHLNSKGHFFFDTHSLDRLTEFEEEFNETGSFDDCDYQWSIMAEDERVYQDFAFYLPDGSMIQEHHIQRVYHPDWLKEELEKLFIIEKTTTDFDLKGICEGEKYFYVCRKR
ncbi:MAG: class I SAM-dependent methyltransferase [Holdemanella sp.]|nr:class I SAM-dependent methyltransferase [Holdemanella sp.]